MAIARVRLPDGRIARFQVNEGVSPQQIEAFAREQFNAGAYDSKPEEQSLISKVGEAALEIGPGLGELGAGAFQRGAELLGREDLSRKVGQKIAKERESLTPAQKAGRSTGKIVGGLIGTGPLTGFLPSTLYASAGLSALEPTEEGTRGAALRQTVVGGATGLATGGLIKGAGGLVTKGTKAVKKAIGKGEEVQQITSETLRARAGELFQEAERAGGRLNLRFKKKFIDGAARDLTPKSAIGRRLGKGSLTDKTLEDIQGLARDEFDLIGIQDLDKNLSDKIYNTADLRGNLTEEGKKILEVQSRLRKMLDNISPKDVTGGKEGFKALKDAKRLWSKSLRLSDIERIIQRAELTDNPSTAIKTGFRTLASNPKKLIGFSEQEKKLIRKAAKTGVITDLFRIAGSRLATIGVGISGAGPTATAATAATGFAGRGAAAKVQANKASKITNEIINSALPNASKLEKDIGQRIIDQLIKTGAISITQLNQDN